MGRGELKRLTKDSDQPAHPGRGQGRHRAGVGRWGCRGPERTGLSGATWTWACFGPQKKNPRKSRLDPVRPARYPGPWGISSY